MTDAAGDGGFWDRTAERVLRDARRLLERWTFPVLPANKDEWGMKAGLELCHNAGSEYVFLIARGDWAGRPLGGEVFRQAIATLRTAGFQFGDNGKLPLEHAPER